MSIKDIECAIIDKGWAEGWVTPQIAARRTGKRVAVVGSGPAGLACAQQLARAGHRVVVFEKNDRIGGLLRYGIPDFKLETVLIDRRLAQMQAEGYAMEFLTQQNRRVAGQKILPDQEILATDQQVIVIGGGDTGSDCVGTSIRQGARSVTQLEIMPKPPLHENKLLTWPNWPLKLRTSTSHEEGCERDWAVATKAFIGTNGQLTALRVARLEWRTVNGRQTMVDVPDSEFEIPADLVLLAMGFVHPVHEGMLQELGVALDERGNIRAGVNDYQTSLNKVFSAGDMRRGQSLVVWAIREGRQCARAVDEFLMGSSELPV